MGGSSLQLRILDGIGELTREQWDGLLAPSAPPFIRWDWLHALEDSGSASAKTGWQPMHLSLWRGERLVGAAPAYAKFHSMGEYVYDFGWANAARSMGVPYYPKLLVGAPLSPITAPRFLVAPGEDPVRIRRVLAESAVKVAEEAECSSVHVIFPQEEDALALESLGYAHRVGMQYHWRNPGYRSYEEFLSRFTSKRRHQLRRERAAANEQGITIRTRRNGALTEADGRLAFRLYESTCEKNPWGHLQLNPGFFERVFQTMRSSVELVEAVRGDKVVAGAFNLSHERRLFGRYWGCFEEHPFLHFNVCMYHSIDDCIARGLEVFEPGAGGEHKIARGFEPTAIHSAHVVFDRRLDRAIRDFVVTEREELEPILSSSEEQSGLRPWQQPPGP